MKLFFKTKNELVFLKKKLWGKINDNNNIKA